MSPLDESAAVIYNFLLKIVRYLNNNRSFVAIIII